VSRSEPDQQAQPRSGRCAIVGRPNVGKSTLLNALLGQKLSIATPKPQTTRTCILGVYTQKAPPLQIAFIDTPGLHAPDNALGRAIVAEARAGLLEAEVVLLVAHVGADKAGDDVLGEHEKKLLEGLRGDPRPVVLAINKVDRLKDKTSLLPCLQRCAEAFPFAAIVPISARNGSGLPALVNEIGLRLPPGLRYQDDLLTDKSERFFAAELVREAVMRQTRQELPYAVAVVIDDFAEDGALSRVTATIVVDKESQKPILIGRGGQRLKEIGTAARHELEALLERKVFLKLWVKVVPGWTERPAAVRELLGADAGATDGGAIEIE
jgi:GTP-binding protein Era